MIITDLLQEINEILTVSTPVPLSKKVIVEPDEIREILKEIKEELPDEIVQAEWIMSQREKILSDAQEEYDRIVADAKAKAERYISESEITIRAKQRAEELITSTKDNCKVMKLSILDYTDGMLYNLQEKTDEIKAIYFKDMYDALNDTFEKMYTNIAASREEVKDQIYRTQSEETK